MLDCPTLAEVLVKLRIIRVTLEDFCSDLRHLPCCIVLWDINLLDDVLGDLWMVDLDSYVWQAINVDTEAILNVLLVFYD